MTRYYGVKCSKCELSIALQLSATRDGKTIEINFVPLSPIECPNCHHSQQYEAADALEFDGPDGLL
jgi:hypothetical protein